MLDLGNSVGSMEKLNEYNYRDWKSCIKSYLIGQDLWDVVDGNETSPPVKGQNHKKWVMRAGKALYVIKTTIDKSLLARIEDVETPKEAWDILAALFSTKNAARLQLLEKELMNVSQGAMSIREYFLKVKNLCREIEQLDPESKFGEGRVRRIIIGGLKPEYNAFITAIQGWPTQPSLTDLENLLANQEALVKQMSGVNVTLRDTEEALYTNMRRGQPRLRGSDRMYGEGACSQRSTLPGGALQHGNRSEDDPKTSKYHDVECYNCGKKGHYARECRAERRPRGECYNCGRVGHYARDCKSEPKVQGNFAKESHQDDESEVVWDFEAPCAMANYCGVESQDDEEWDVSSVVWIGDLEEGEGFEVAASSIVMEEIEQEEVSERLTKKTSEQDGSRERDVSEVVQGHEEKALEATRASLLGKLTEIRDVDGKRCELKAAYEGVQETLSERRSAGQTQMQEELYEVAQRQAGQKQGELIEVAPTKILVSHAEGTKETKTSRKYESPWRTGVRRQKIKKSVVSMRHDNNQVRDVEI